MRYKVKVVWISIFLDGSVTVTVCLTQLSQILSEFCLFAWISCGEYERILAVKNLMKSLYLDLDLNTKKLVFWYSSVRWTVWIVNRYSVPTVPTLSMSVTICIGHHRVELHVGWVWECQVLLSSVATNTIRS